MGWYTMGMEKQQIEEPPKKDDETHKDQIIADLSLGTKTQEEQEMFTRIYQI